MPTVAVTTPRPLVAPVGIALPTPLPAPARLPAQLIQVMLLGTDRRPPDEDWRTDTMILVTIDPQQKVASMLSMPRDLYVTIPGFGKARLNTADNIGEAQGYPGGGPGLLRTTLKENLGITFDHYIRIDFQGFTHAIDSLGGIDVDVRCPTELWVPDRKAPDGYALYRTIPAGMQHMDGDLALFYSRCRAHTPAFDRDRRQREVLLALRNRVLELGISGLLPRLFGLLDTMRESVQTDMDAAEIMSLAQLIAQIPPQNINTGGVDLTLAPEWTTSQGAWVMLPQRQRIKEFVEGLRGPPTWEASSLAGEGVLIAVENGATIEGLAFQTADRLKAQGYQVVEVGKSETLDHAQTAMISYGDPSFTLESLRQHLHLEEAQIRYEPDWLSRVGIRVILGTDAQPLCR